MQGYLAQMPGLPNMLWLCLLSESESSVNPEPEPALWPAPVNCCTAWRTVRCSGRVTVLM